MQYYHKIGVLSPTAESQGGRRLYTRKDMVKLHQILSLKSLGFSLDEIKRWMISLDTPGEVENALTRQALAIENKIDQLTIELKTVKALKAEVLGMQNVDFKKYADIIMNLQMNNEYYGLIKYFDKSSGKQFMDRFNRMRNKALELQEHNIPPENESAELLPPILENLGKLFPASRGYILLSQMNVSLHTLSPLLIIFTFAIISGCLLLRKIRIE